MAVKRTGRPTKPPVPGQRMSLGLKVTADIKNQLDAAARASGRTQSQEAELRLDRSFRDEDITTFVAEFRAEIESSRRLKEALLWAADTLTVALRQAIE